MLELLALNGAQSRADLARAAGITRATAGNLVARLLAEGIVRHAPTLEAEKDRSVGRPGEQVALNPDFAHVVGIDAGIGFVLALRMDLAGTIRAVERVEIPLAEETPERLAALVTALVRKVCDTAPPIAGVAIAIPGIITRDGHVMRAPFLGWTDVPFRDLIEDELAPFGTLALENDANALAMGEVIRGHVSPDDTNIFFSMDVGVGGSIIWEGRLMD
ncbi:MAG: ROK family transcriptional regulator, partial [Pseudomonadota bacterium]